MNATLYGIGVGPGDWELLTLKAVRLILEADVVAVPKTDENEKTALHIVKQGVDLTGKEILEVHLPMTRDQKKLDESHQKAAQELIALLDQGKDIAFLTLGDPSVYSTYAYLHRRVLAAGRSAQLVAGVPSFCAVAARLNTTLCEGGEALHIIPASYQGAADYLDWKGTKVLMKTGRQFPGMREELRNRGLIRQAEMVERCGMENEKVFRDLDQVEDQTSYFSIILVKDNQTRDQ